MPHIKLPDGAPGISGPLQAYPETAVHLQALVQALLRGPSSLSSAERELLAASVSSGNECVFCMRSHAAAARHLDAVACDAPTPKLRALLAIAEKVRRSGREVLAEDVIKAREAGADDRAIHDTVLIAAAFCMFNRYVDGLDTPVPQDEAVYDRMGLQLAKAGYGAIKPR